MPDEDNPEWTREMFESATNFEDSNLPEEFKAAIRKDARLRKK